MTTDWEKLLNRPTLELTGMFQDRSIPEHTRDLAFHALCHRFKEDVLKKCEIICKRFGHSVTVAEQICETTFFSYAKKGDFRIENANIKKVDNAFKVYLYKIARNELTNYYRSEERKRKNPYDGSERIITELPSLEGMELSLEDKIRFKAIESLSPAQRTVYLTYTQYEKLGFNLPLKLRLELRKHLGGVEQVTVRGYKKEAIDIINNCLKVMNLTKELSDGKFK